MNFNDRAKIVRTKKVEGTIGSSYQNVAEDYFRPCGKTSLSLDAINGMFGDYRKGSYTLHFQGKIDGITAVIHEGKERSAQSISFKRNTTVVVV